MPLDRPDQEYTPSPDLAQRWAHRYIHRLLKRTPALAAAKPQAIKRLKRLKRWTLARAAGLGICSGTLIGGGEWWMKHVTTSNWPAMSFNDQLPYWASYYALVGLVTALEVGFLYWNSLHSVTQLIRLSGTRYTRDEAFGPTLTLTIHGVARIALEQPGSGDPVYGIDPHVYLKRWKLTLKALLYRLKISLSSFVLRLVMRRLLGRLALRGFIPLLMGPLYALWNAWISLRILHRAQLVTWGPERIASLVTTLKTHTPERRRLIIQGIGELIRRNRHPHPNLVLLIGELLASLPDAPRQVDIQWPTTLARYAQLEQAERRVVLTSLSEAVMLSGVYRGSRKRFLREVHAHCQTPLPSVR